jgi:hypothetical protein
MAGVQVLPSGDARVSILAQGLPDRSREDLARAVAELVFPGLPLAPTAPGGDADPLAWTGIEVRGAVAPGALLTVHVPGAALDTLLRDAGAATVGANLCLPNVPTEIDVPTSTKATRSRGCLSIVPDDGGSLPSFDVVLRPGAWRWLVGVIAAALAVVLAGLAWWRRLRSLGASALVAVAVAAAVGSGSSDDATLAGLAGPSTIRGASTLIFWVAVASVVAALAAMARAHAGATTASPLPIH